MSAAPRMAHWVIRLPDGTEYHSDVLTLDELEHIEGVAGTPWSVLNPLARVKDAKAFYVFALMRSGLSEVAALQRLKALTLAEASTAFTWVPAEREDAEDGEELPPSSAPTSTAG